MFNTILFPIDQTSESRDAVDTVANVVKTYNSRLVLLSVVEKKPTSEATPEDRLMTSVEAVAELLEDAKNLFTQVGIETQMIEREGVPAFVICDVADEIEANLIIMGCRGFSLTNTDAAESVTTRVINLSPCPVLVVP